MNSRQLLTEQRKGAEILHNGAPVEYAPRQHGDSTPWVYVETLRKGTRLHRYTAAQCVAYHPQR